MPTPILTTKLYIPPPRPQLVRRPRLIERLNHGLHRKLTLISAAAGFGKTTLVGEWIAAAEGPRRSSVAWLSLEEADSEPRRFLTYVVAALQTLVLNGENASAQRIGEGLLAELQSPQPSSTESILTALLNEITGISENFVLVLDDYHLIDATPVDEALAFLVEHLPPQMHLVIVSREDPPLPLARYRARGQLSELRAADLRFTPGEAAGLFNQIMGLTLSASEIEALEARTEGWIAGLQLAALSMQGREDTAVFVEAFAGSHSFILDYLVEEVLQRQPDHVRDFLLRTSILDRLCGPLCDAVTGQEDGQGMLVSLERGNLFVVPLDDSRQWYRYHHLFADVLQAHAHEEELDLLPVLYRQAGEWCERNDQRSDAIRYALAADDFEWAADLIELAWPAMDGDFQSVTWLGWAADLPKKLVRSRPVLCVAYAWALLNDGELEPAEEWLIEAEQWMKNAPDAGAHRDVPRSEMTVVDEEQFRTLPASIATARTYLSQAYGDIPGSMKYAEQAFELLPADDYVRRGPAAALLGLAHWERGELAEAHEALAEAMAGFKMAGSIAFALSGTYGMADIRIAQGRLRAATRTYEQALRLVAEEDGPLIKGTADLYLGLSELCHERGDLEGAREHLLKSEELGEQAALADWPYRMRIAQARIKTSEGELDRAIELLDQAERLYFRTPVPDVRPVAAWRVRAWIAQGRIVDALSWVRDQGLAVDVDPSYIREFEHITLARLLIAQHRIDRTDESSLLALDLLSRLLKAAEAGKRIGSEIEILMLKALAYQDQGDSPSALESLEQALTLAEPEGFVRIFVDEGPPMTALLDMAANEGIAASYVDRLRAASGSTDVRPPVTQQLLEPLSDRELEVLRLLDTELSGPEIARELVISLNTVRTHTKNIYGKLGVNSRRAAVGRAQELDLV